MSGEQELQDKTNKTEELESENLKLTAQVNELNSALNAAVLEARESKTKSDNLEKSLENKENDMQKQIAENESLRVEIENGR